MVRTTGTDRELVLSRPGPATFALDDVAAAVTPDALQRAAALGCRHAELRVERIRTQMVVVRDGRLETAVDDVEVGAGLRVVSGNGFGFAATDAMERDSVAALADSAVAVAAACSSAVRRPVELAGEPRHGAVTWVAAHQVDPTSVPLADRVALLQTWCGQVMAGGASHVTASVMAVTEEKHFADLAGNAIRQLRVRVHPVVEAVRVADDGDFESMRTLAPPVAQGWEYLEDPGSGPATELDELGGLLEAKLRAPSVTAGPYDLVIDPSNLWLTIHESVGHALELDRVLGYEAAYAGTSFAPLAGIGSFRYGSPLMQVTGDRTVAGGLATVGFDDEGVAGQAFDLVRDGILVGFQLDRRMAAEQGVGRSNGCGFADSPMHVPIQRMANVSLAADPDGPSTAELVAGTDDGILVVGDKSWSIDMQRYNFQFTGQRFFRIRNGRLAGQLRDVAYQSRTSDFWSSLDALGGPSTYLLGGAMNCGKGQPGQVAPVSHGCPVARFRSVPVLNARVEAGR